MLVQIAGVLSAEQVRSFRKRLDAAQWVDGNVTSGHQSALAKVNEQLPEDSPEARELGEQVLAGLAASPLFFTAALPKQVFPPLFNRYRDGMTFGNHIDGAIRTHAPTRVRLRTDLSATLFLSDPGEYDGGELLVEDTYGTQSVKLAAGDLVLYPSTSVHRVNAITRGVRVASFFWIQSMVRDDARRTLMFDLDAAVMRLSQQLPRADPSLVQLVGVYHNLLRMWAEP
jgi:PKHD-type hydroxylase